MQQLVSEVDEASSAMLEGLMGKLRGPIQLPECLRVVGCLRRLAPFSEAELRRRYRSGPYLSRKQNYNLSTAGFISPKNPLHGKLENHERSRVGKSDI